MSSHKRSKKKRKAEFTSLAGYRKVGNQLEHKSSNLPFAFLEWEKSLLPEFLWIDYLVQKSGEANLHVLYDNFLNILEQYFDTSKVYLCGTITDFGRVPIESRQKILRNEKKTIYHYFENLIAPLLLLYPECPANWLISAEFRENTKVNYEHELANLKRSLIRLYPAKDDYCGFLRMLPLKRALKHQKISFNDRLDFIDLLATYPDKCTHEERKKVESLGRTVVNMILTGMQNASEPHISREWCEYFWNHNFDISVCEEFTYVSEKDIDDQEKELMGQIPQRCLEISKAIQDYIFVVNRKYKHRLFDPSKDEVILGLFARISRITILLLSDHSFWPVDIARIFQRCLVDSSINLVYMLSKKDEHLYQAFINHGLGKEKLLMLHLQDQYQNSKGPSGENIEQLKENLGGGFAAELLDVELGSWAKVDTRKMAIDVGFDDLYRLIYDPASGDVHGNWTSLRNTNLVRCINPLHRFHRLANITVQPIFVDNLKISIHIYERTVNKCVELAQFPKFENELSAIGKILDRLKQLRGAEMT